MWGYTFDFSFPTERQGFVVADLLLPDGKVITVTSIHLVWLDWIRRQSRVHQLALIERILTTRQSYKVIAGDMNCNYLGNETSLKNFVVRNDLRLYDVTSKDLNTYPSWAPTKRIDWVITSSGMQFTAYSTAHDKVSDHVGVFVKLSV